MLIVLLLARCESGGRHGWAAAGQAYASRPGRR